MAIRLSGSIKLRQIAKCRLVTNLFSFWVTSRMWLGVTSRTESKMHFWPSKMIFCRRTLTHFFYSFARLFEFEWFWKY